MIAVKNKNITNSFISLLNCKMREANGPLYTEQFTDINSDPHRLEYFLSVRGVSFIDDTKAQSVNAIWYSLESMNCPVTLIVKDIDDVQELLKIRQLLILKVKGMVFLNKNKKYTRLLLPLVGAVHFADTMKEAVSWAFENTEREDAVLFCAGTKVNVAEESKRFQEAVREL